MMVSYCETLVTHVLIAITVRHYGLLKGRRNVKKFFFKLLKEKKKTDFCESSVISYAILSWSN